MKFRYSKVLLKYYFCITCLLLLVYLKPGSHYPSGCPSHPSQLSPSATYFMVHTIPAHATAPLSQQTQLHGAHLPRQRGCSVHVQHTTVYTSTVLLVFILLAQLVVTVLYKTRPHTSADVASAKKPQRSVIYSVLELRNPPARFFCILCSLSHRGRSILVLVLSKQ